MKIGFFDSGLGGLTILRAVAKCIPQYDYYFYGDTAHLPYGEKTEEEIYILTIAGMTHLFEAECQLVIIACNTASAETARRLQVEFLPQCYPDRKILGIIVPTIESLQYPNVTRVMLLATTRTVASGKYDTELALKGNQNVLLTSVPAPELVLLIEAGKLEAATQRAIELIDAAGEGDVIVLGCTHYTEIKSGLRAHYGETRRIVSQDEIIPEKLQAYLAAHPEVERVLSDGGTRTIHLTEHRPDYDNLMQQFLAGSKAGSSTPENR